MIIISKASRFCKNLLKVHMMRCLISVEARCIDKWTYNMQCKCAANLPQGIFSCIKKTF